MNLKTIKLLIGIFLGVLCVFLALMVLGRYDAGNSGTEVGAGAKAEKMLAEARASGDTKEKAPVFYRTGLTTESFRSEGIMMIVKDGAFEGVAEAPRGVMEMLTDMSGSNKKKPPTVYLTDADLTKKIIVGPGKPEAPLSASVVPGMGKSASVTEGKAMISAPVDYKVFRDSETWKAFESTHKGPFPPCDFSREEMLILVSVSDLPSVIFKIDGLKRSAKETVVLYRVDPLAMAAANGTKELNSYSAVAIPKAIDVELKQIP